MKLSDPREQAGSPGPEGRRIVAPAESSRPGNKSGNDHISGPEGRRKCHDPVGPPGPPVCSLAMLHLLTVTRPMAAKPASASTGLRKDALATGPRSRRLGRGYSPLALRASGPERIRPPDHGAGTRSAKIFERVLLLRGRKPSASNTLPRPQEAGVQNFATPRSPRSKVQSMGAKGFVAGVHATIGEVGLATLVMLSWQLRALVSWIAHPMVALGFWRIGCKDRWFSAGAN
jgi:hypothetical protein